MTMSNPPTGLKAGPALLRPAIVLLFLAAACQPGPRSGGEVTEPRVLALAPGLAELVWAAGAGDLLVARVAHTDQPPEAASLPLVGSGLEPDPEAMIAAGVNTVFLLEDMRGGTVAQSLERLGFELIFLEVQTPEDVISGMELISKKLGRSSRAEAAIQDLRGSLKRLGQPGQRPLRVLMVHGRRPLYVAGPGSWGDHLITLAGHRNALGPDHDRSARLGWEEVLLLDPDVIVDTSSVYSPPGEPLLPGDWPRSTPVVDLGPKDLSLLRPGPRFPEAAQTLIRLLKPLENRP